MERGSCKFLPKLDYLLPLTPNFHTPPLLFPLSFFFFFCFLQIKILQVEKKNGAIQLSLLLKSIFPFFKKNKNKLWSLYCFDWLCLMNKLRNYRKVEEDLRLFIFHNWNLNDGQQNLAIWDVKSLLAYRMPY